MKLSFYVQQQILESIFKACHSSFKYWGASYFGLDLNDTVFPLPIRLSLSLVCRKWADIINLLYFRYCNVFHLSPNSLLRPRAYSRETFESTQLLMMKFNYQTNFVLSYKMELQDEIPTDKDESNINLVKYKMIIDGLIDQLKRGNVNNLKIIFCGLFNPILNDLLPHLPLASRLIVQVDEFDNLDYLCSITGINAVQVRKMDARSLDLLNASFSKPNNNQSINTVNFFLTDTSYELVDCTESVCHLLNLHNLTALSIQILFSMPKNMKTIDYTYINKLKQLRSLKVELLDLSSKNMAAAHQSKLSEVLVTNKTITKLVLQNQVKGIPIQFNYKSVRKLCVNDYQQVALPNFESADHANDELTNFYSSLNFLKCNLNFTIGCRSVFEGIRRLDYQLSNNHYDFSFLEDKGCGIVTLNVYNIYYDCTPLFMSLSRNQSVQNFFIECLNKNYSSNKINEATQLLLNNNTALRLLKTKDTDFQQTIKESNKFKNEYNIKIPSFTTFTR